VLHACISCRIGRVSDAHPIRERERVARFGLAVRVVLLVLKVAAAVFTGSIGIIADAIHGLVDLSGAGIGYVGVRIAGKPADEEHLFGHERAEDIAAASIATLIFFAAVIVAYEAIGRLTGGTPVHMVAAGIGAEIVVVTLKVFASRRLLRASRQLDSTAIEAMGKDFEADVLSSGAVLTGLVLVELTGLTILDPLAAILVVGLVVQAAYTTMRKAITSLMDTRLPPAEEHAILDALRKRTDLQNYHALRTRKAGSQRYVQMHIVVGKDRTVEAAHRIAEEIEQDIRKALPGSAVIIHIEPCTPACDSCPAECYIPPDKSEPH
jgi:cation diffusion facilitator family transporter